MSWNDGKKIDAVTSFLILGNMVLVSQTTGVPLPTLRVWKKEPWWADMVLQVQTESDQELDSKLAKRIEKALEIVNDRLDKGDFQYDPKTGSFVRRPVSVKDGWKVANEMIDKRWLLRKQPNEQVDQTAVGDILRNLAKEFADMAKKRVKEKLEPEVKDGPEQIEEKLQEGIQELPREAGANSQPE